MLFATKMSFLGQTLAEDGFLPDTGNVAKILNWPVHKMVHEKRGILGLGSYYHCFIWDFSDQVQPLIPLTKKGKPFQCSE